MTEEQQRAFPFQFITHRTESYTYYQSAEMALRGGCKWIQLRMKDVCMEEVKEVARQLKPLCKAHHAVFVLDDYVELCREIKADGVHLGKQDMSPQKAREILGDKSIIGSTCNTYEDILLQTLSPVDYIGLGPFRYTSTKANLSPVLGITQYQTILSKCSQAGIRIPIVAIGGITLGDIRAIGQTGVRGFAFSGAILQANNPMEETEKILNEIKTYQINLS
ncbi:MAG: thiamine phosphate synthase [Bacteroidales bacterium]|jgi:thiamine-phosphate pyrophosphorylase|nr:thiamine phosphate synthase [Bacteroidales bacterium]